MAGRQAALPRTEAPAAPGSSFSTVDRGVRSAPARPARRAAPGDRGSRRSRMRTGCGPRGPRDSGWRRLLPSCPLDLPPRPRSRPRGSPPGVLRVGAVSWRRAEQRGRAASSHSRCSGHRHPRRGAQAAPAAAARARSPGPLRSLAPSSASPPGNWDQSSARGSRDARPVRATRRREEATVTWDRDARRCRLGQARLRRRHTPGCPRSPDPAAPRKHRPCPWRWPDHAPAPCPRRR